MTGNCNNNNTKSHVPPPLARVHDATFSEPKERAHILRSLPWLVTAELVLLFGRENKNVARETKFKSAVVIMGCSRWAESLLRCSYRVRLKAAFKFLLVASFFVWGCVVMYYKGESDYNMVYVAGQCIWKSYGNLEKYYKSGLEFPCLTNVLQRSSQDSHGGFFDAEFPTDKVRDVT